MDTRSKKNLQGKVLVIFENGEPTMPPLNKLKSGAFTLEFKLDLPQNAGKKKGDKLEVR